MTAPERLARIENALKLYAELCRAECWVSAEAQALEALSDVRALATGADAGLVKQDQREGDMQCYAACLATITGVPFDAFPRLHPGMSSVEFWGAVDGVMKPRGWFIAHSGAECPAGYAIATGPGPRGLDHSVVVCDGRIFHDPHPSRAGLIDGERRYSVPVRTVPQDGGTRHPDADRAISAPVPPEVAAWRAQLRTQDYHGPDCDCMRCLGNRLCAGYERLARENAELREVAETCTRLAGVADYQRARAFEENERIQKESAALLARLRAFREKLAWHDAASSCWACGERAPEHDEHCPVPRFDADFPEVRE